MIAGRCFTIAWLIRSFSSFLRVFYAQEIVLCAHFALPSLVVAHQHTIFLRYGKSSFRNIKNLSLHFCRDRIIPAVPPCLARCALSHVLPYADLFTSGRSVSHTLLSAFLFALRSPFDLSSSAAIPASAALCAISDKTYSLFVIGLGVFDYADIIAYKNSFVKCFFKNILLISSVSVIKRSRR